VRVLVLGQLPVQERVQVLGQPRVEVRVPISTAAGRSSMYATMSSRVTRPAIPVPDT
jgi:hypothetical protein